MKKILTINSLIVILLSGCMQSRYITEKLIKNETENHQVNQFSSISTYTIFKGYSYDQSSYLELTGYKYGDQKGLIIGADRYYRARKTFQGDKTTIAEITYIELTLAQCKSILTNYKLLQDKIKAEKPKINEAIYHDLTVSSDLFISYRKTMGKSGISFINLWIKGEKYEIYTTEMLKRLKMFVDY